MLVLREIALKIFPTIQSLSNINTFWPNYYRNPNGSSRHNSPIIEENEEKKNFHKHSTDFFNGSEVIYHTASKTDLMTAKKWLFTYFSILACGITRSASARPGKVIGSMLGCGRTSTWCSALISMLGPNRAIDKYVKICTYSTNAMSDAGH